MSSQHLNLQQYLQIVQPLQQSLRNIPKQEEETNLKPDKITEEPNNTQKIQMESNLKKRQNLKEPSKQTDKKRKKLILYKCKVCKTTGKRSDVKMCSKCKFHFHIECILPQKIINDDSKTFVCQLCDKHSATTIQVNQISSRQKSHQNFYQKEKTNKIQQNSLNDRQKSCNGFLNISKLQSLYQTNFKKQEWKRKLYQFYKKYPYCFQKNKVIFPIEDHLLHIYQSILPSYCKTTTPKPVPSFPKDGVPEKFYNQLMEIQAFFQHFWQDLKMNNFFRPETIKEKQMNPEKIKRKNLYQKFVKQGMDDLYVWILETLLRMYLNDIMDRNRIDNMKFVGLSPFFNLLSVIAEDKKRLSTEFIIKAAPEIIKNLTKTPSFRHSFNCDYENGQNHLFQYPKHFTCEKKIKLIAKLIRGLCDTDCFKEIVAKKSEQISILTKQKGQNLQKLKALQNQNIPLKQQIKQLENQLKQLAFSDPKQYSKKYESSNKNLQKLVMTYKENLEKIQKYKQQLKQIARKIPFVNGAVKFLGVDRFRSEYFFYKLDSSRIYVKYRESFLEEQYQKGFMCYQSKEEIEKLKSWLNAKGANEKGLLFNITNLQQKDLLVFKDPPKNSDYQDFEFENNNMIEQQTKSIGTKVISRQQNLQTLLYCENLYKQTIPNLDTIEAREKQIQQIFKKLYQSEGDIITQKNKSDNDSSQNSLRELFSKYPSKLLQWNQKAKRFWSQFLDLYIKEPQYQTETNLFIIVTVWKISMELYHSQFMRKKLKIQKKKQKTLLEKEINNFILRNSDIEQQTSQNEQNSTPFTPQQHHPMRKLRKRQTKNKPIQEQENLSFNQSQYPSSKKQESVNANSQPSSKSEKDKKSNSNSKQKKQGNSRTRKNKNKLENVIYSLNQESQAPEIFQKNNVGSSKNVSFSQKSVQKSNELLLQFQQQQVSSPEEFCEECFQNVNYDKNSKIKVVRCHTCSKTYHKKCLRSVDITRLNKMLNQWECSECFEKVQVSHLKLQNKKESVNKQIPIVSEKKKIQAKTTNTKRKESKKQNQLFLQNEAVKKSKVTQKILKKQRKINEKNKIDQSQEIINSESSFNQDQYENKSKKTRSKSNKNKKQKENDDNNKNLAKKRQKSSSQINNSFNNEDQNVKSGRQKRKATKKKKIVESQSQEYEQNSQEEQYVEE